MVTAARLICKKCRRSSTIRNQLCRSRIFRTTSRCSVSCSACRSVSFRKTWWAQAQEGSAGPPEPLGPGGLHSHPGNECNQAGMPTDLRGVFFDMY